MLKKIAGYNDVSPELLPPLPKKGTVVTYRFREVQYDPIKKEKYYPSMVKLPATSNYWDAQKEAWVRVGMVTGEDVKTKDAIFLRNLLWTEPQKSAGYLAVTIGESSAKDMLYQYLELASFVHNESRTIRDESEPLLLEKVDYEGDARKKRAEKKRSREAWQSATELKGEELKKVALLFGFYVPGTDIDSSLFRKVVEDYAETHPDEYFNRIGDPYADAKATINHADLAGIVKRSGLSLIWSDTEAPLIPLTQEGAIAEQFAKYLSENKEDGERILAELKSLLDKQTKSAAAQSKKK